MSRANIILIFILILIVAAVAGFTFRDVFKEKANETGVAHTLQPEGALPYTDLNGNPVDLANFEGKTLVINSWASWCPFCVTELPDFETLAAEFKDRDVVVIAINRAEPQGTAQAFVDYIGGAENIVYLLDRSDTFYKTIGGFAMPETVIYHADGSEAARVRGEMRIEEMRQRVEGVLFE